MNKVNNSDISVGSTFYHIFGTTTGFFDIGEGVVTKIRQSKHDVCNCELCEVKDGKQTEKSFFISPALLDLNLFSNRKDAEKRCKELNDNIILV